MDRLHRREVFGEGGFPAAAGRYLLNGEIALHSHDFLEIAFLRSGTAVHLRPDGGTPLQSGSVVAVRPGQVHGYADCVEADILNLYVGPELLRRELVWTLDHPDLARFLLRGGMSTSRLTGAAATALERWLSTLAEQTAPVGSPRAAVALGLLCCALGELATCTFDVGTRRAAISPVVRRAWQLMVDDPAYPWSMADLAGRLNVSVPHLHRRFTEEVGTPPMTWLARTRGEIAASLLIQSERPVADIGRLVGWSDANYFSRRFRELVGSSPSEYRKRFHS
ncbi:MAG: AraC family transcriptional regulator [Propionibacteriaceae bacterium]